MNLNSYKLNVDPTNRIFEFTSEGPNGQIPKIIKFEEIRFFGFYNLSFGKKCNDLNEMDDTSISNNGDSSKILATVVKAIYKFTDVYPGCWIVAEGSTPSRNRLYRMGITKYLQQAIDDFEILGFKDLSWKSFERNEEYKAFLARRKQNFKL